MKKEFFFFQSSAVTRLKFPSYFYFYVVLVWVGNWREGKKTTMMSIVWCRKLSRIVCRSEK
jgi:hypothetical protein